MPHREIEQGFEVLPKYAHLRPADVEIWQRFVEQNPGRFKRVFYDFKVGDAADVDEEITTEIKGAWYDLTRWAIDVVAEDERTIYIVEVKPNANSKAIGQALSYAVLYREEQSPKKRVVPVVLTDTIIKTTARCARGCGVQMWEA